jgi:glycerol-3-phosphate dehydrogenase
MVPVSRSRFVFALPAADGRVYAGVTDEPVPELPDGDPLPPAADVEWLLRAFDPVLSSPLDDRDVIGAYTGFRPLLPGAGAGPTADLSRRHLVRQAPNGLISVVGGKLTTYRRMAEDAVDLAVSIAGLRAGRCRTRRLPLAGAVARRDLPGTAAPARLVARYGSEAPAIWHGDRTPVAPGLAVTAAELRFAVDHEGALDAADLLDRRTRIGLVAHDRAAGAAAAERAMR